MAYNEDSSASGHDEPWIQWFCGLKGHEMFCEVERSYIEDGFNLYGLRACVSNFSDCLDLILDRIGPDDSDDSHLTQSACTLYGLIHARYIITAHGLDAMYNKYANKEFGTCPLIQCNGQPVLPVGLKDEMGVDTVKIFCPKCQCVYHPPPIRSRSSHHGPGGSAGGSGSVDGAAFGTTFPHLFLMTFNNLVPDPLDPQSAYIPRVFGFRVHQSARQRNSGGGSGSAAAFSSSTLPQANNSRRAMAAAPVAASSRPTSSALAGVTSTGAGGPSTAPDTSARHGHSQAHSAVVDKTPAVAADPSAPKTKANSSKGTDRVSGNGVHGTGVALNGGDMNKQGQNGAGDGSQDKGHGKRKSKGTGSHDGSKGGESGENSLKNKSKRQKGSVR
mmetsp:Transcript_4834/g.13727  ORF Transcript_4834/g.13727 Transcript_4834/m.13727 type:complete len:388 (+) Transcript_4834:1499-2662(+)